MPFQVAPIARHAAFARGMGAFIGAHPRVFPSSFQLNLLGKFTEYYCQNNGSNLNSGTDRNASAKYTSTNGNWSTTTLQFIPTDSSIPIGTVFPGDIVSIYVDASATTGYLARVTSVADGVNGAITVVGLAGTAPTTSATTRSIKVGGAWKGPTGAVTWPMNTNLDSATNANGDPVRINFKNDQTYTVSVSIVSGGSPHYWGYSVSPGDGGKATFDAGGGNFSLLNCGSLQEYVDLIFQNNATGVNTALAIGAGAFYRCVFHDSGGAAFSVNSTTASAHFYECEFYRGNLNNATSSGVVGGTSTATFYRCYFHDSIGNNNKLALDVNGSIFIECIFADSQTNAIGQDNDNTTSLCRVVIGCIFYNIARACIDMTNGAGTVARRQTCYNNIAVNCGSFISTVGSTSGNRSMGTVFNTAYYNVPKLFNLNSVSRDIMEFGGFALSGDPFVSAPTGDFRLSGLEAVSKGRGAFTETATGKSGTISYPDVGAVQALISAVISVVDEGLGGVGGG